MASAGSVGLDESLDLQVSIRLPRGLLGESELANRLTGQPLSFSVVGTLDAPELQLPEGAPWIQTIDTFISGSAQDQGISGIIESAADVLGGILGDSREKAGPDDGPRFPRLRRAIEQRLRGAEDPPPR